MPLENATAPRAILGGVGYGAAIYIDALYRKESIKTK